jgi:hypothetical protein
MARAVKQGSDARPRETQPEREGEAADDKRNRAAGVYFTACINRIFGRMPGQRAVALQEAMVAVPARAGCR